MKPLSPPYYIYKIKAFIVDMFMIYIPIMYIMTYLVLDGKEDLAASNLAPFIATSLYGIVYAIFISQTGQTPGKKAYEIKIVDVKTLEKISFFRALSHFFAFLFTVTTLFGLFLPLVRKDNRQLHDILASTKTMYFQDSEK